NHLTEISDIANLFFEFLLLCHSINFLIILINSSNFSKSHSNVLKVIQNSSQKFFIIQYFGSANAFNTDEILPLFL
ncbi:MAG: hypothetical protein LBF15_02095, partial [Candidatus Peribacteria bacterium]|nr:hypothetical protein [Candidatus Peribacteria bacterium]